MKEKYINEVVLSYFVNLVGSSLIYLGSKRNLVLLKKLRTVLKLPTSGLLRWFKSCYYIGCNRCVLALEYQTRWELLSEYKIIIQMCLKEGHKVFDGFKK